MTCTSRRGTSRLISDASCSRSLCMTRASAALSIPALLMDCQRLGFRGTQPCAASGIEAVRQASMCARLRTIFAAAHSLFSEGSDPQNTSMTAHEPKQPPSSNTVPSVDGAVTASGHCSDCPSALAIL